MLMIISLCLIVTIKLINFDMIMMIWLTKFR